MKPETTSAWLPFALLALFSWGVWGFLTKLSANRVSWQTMMLFFGACILLLALAFGTSRPKADAHHLIALAAGAACALGFLFFFHSIARGPASTVIPVTSLYVAVAALLAFGFLGEPLTWRKALGISSAVVAVFLLAE